MREKYSKGNLNRIIDNQKVISIANTESAFKTLPALKNCCVVMEASGGYEQPFVLYLLNKNIAVANSQCQASAGFRQSYGYSCQK